MEHKSRSASEHRERANSMLKGAGYAPAKAAVSKHEAHLHKGEPRTKLAGGGKVKAVNVNIRTGASPEEKQANIQQGMQVGAKMAAQKMAGAGAPPGGAPRPPMAPGAPMGAPAPGGPMPMRPGAGPMAKGGTVKVRAHTRSRGGKCE
jgi:hypothetical protein